MTIVGWILTALPLGLALYAYLLYPALLAVLARLHRRPAPPPLAELPFVSMVVPAYNEEAQIRGAIEALLAQDYPADRCQILILSDASTDQTDAIVGEYRAQGVELLRMPTRGGKTAAENAALSLLRGEIVVNSDSSVRLQSSAIRRLVTAMTDPTVGVASTRDVSVSAVGSANMTEAGYVNYEMRVRQLESDTGGIVGASGSGYAIRSHLHRIPIRVDLSRDFSAALTARLNGYCAVSVDDAVCYVPRTAALATEYKRKVRTIARGLETLLNSKQLLDPTQYGVFAWKLLSHKVCRWLLPPSCVLALFGLVILSFVSHWAILALAAVALLAGGAGAAAAVALKRHAPRLIEALAFGAAANLAVLHALLRVVHGHKDHMWEPTRRTSTIA